ncbi:MAG: Crp/Fnr family transcriptional regulator [Caldilineaceae bacterium]
MPISVLEALADHSTRHVFAPNQIIFDEGAPVAGLYVVASGTVKICRFSKEGREYILQIFQHGDTFNDVAAMDGGPNPATAIAMTDTVLWRIGRHELQMLAHKYPTLAWVMLESIARRTRYLVHTVQDLAMRSVRARLARLLLEQARSSSSSALPQLLTQEEMASRLGTVREVIGRALRSLAAAGIIEIDRHRVVILDLQRLEEESEL